MAELTHLYKPDRVIRTKNSTAEITEWKIDWTDLTGAGFAAGDKIFIWVQFTFNNESTSQESEIEMRQGTSYALGTKLFSTRVEGNSSVPPTDRQQGCSWIDEITLTNGDDWYFGVVAKTGGDYTNYGNFTVWVFKTADLGANDYKYAENVPTDPSPSTYNTDGPSITIPADGTYLIVGHAQWLLGASSSDVFAALDIAGTTRWELNRQREDSDEVFQMSPVWAGVLNEDDVVQLLYKTEDAGHDCDRAAIMVLRLDAFEDFSISVDDALPSLSHSSSDTFQEFGGFSAFNPSQTGNVFVLGATKHTLSASADMPYGRLQVGGADWPDGNQWDASYAGHAADCITSMAMFAVASMTTGAKDIDCDAADGNPGSTSKGKVCVAFSLELAGAAPTSAVHKKSNVAQLLARSR